jgi:hypothetical protein
LRVPNSYGVLWSVVCDIEGDWHNNWSHLLQKGTVTDIWKKMLTATRALIECQRNCYVGYIQLWSVWLTQSRMVPSDIQQMPWEIHD